MGPRLRTWYRRVGLLRLCGLNAIRARLHPHRVRLTRLQPVHLGAGPVRLLARRRAARLAAMEQPAHDVARAAACRRRGGPRHAHTRRVAQCHSRLAWLAQRRQLGWVGLRRVCRARIEVRHACGFLPILAYLAYTWRPGAVRADWATIAGPRAVERTSALCHAGVAGVGVDRPSPSPSPPRARPRCCSPPPSPPLALPARRCGGGA